MKITNELMFIGLDSRKKEGVLEYMGNQLYKSGYVTEGFVAGVTEREENFPTGLPTMPYAIVIPHTDSDKVIESTIAFATLKNKVPFKVMGDSESEVDVKIVFMLALNDPNQQLETLKKLTGIFQDEKMVAKLGDVKNVEDCSKLISIIK